MRDVFYFGDKPNVHPRERYAKSLEDAKSQSTTEHFWIVNEHSDYSNHDWDFDFDLLPDDQVWTEDHINIWPSQYHKDSGTWLCPTDNNHPDKIYRNDVTPIARITSDDHWVMLDDIDKSSFDFSWYPDPNDPPYIYVWGCKYYPAEIKHVLEYRVPGATEIKYMTGIVELNPQWDRWEILEDIEMDLFDFGWRPDPREPNYIFVFGNQHYGSEEYPTVRYYSPKATQSKFEPAYVAKLKERKDRFEIFTEVDNFDFTWRPHPKDLPYIYIWGNKYEPAERKPTMSYTVKGATQVKYMGNVDVKPQWNRWEIFNDIDEDKFDFTWRPDPDEPPYIYVWGTKYKYESAEEKPALRYVVPGATQIKYIQEPAPIKPDMNKWEILEDIDPSSFDFTWRPDPDEPPFIYVFGNQHYPSEKYPTIRYHTAGATQVKYMSQTAKVKPDMSKWEIYNDIDEDKFDFTWRPDPDEPPYIYVWGTKYKYESAEEKPALRYVVPGATQIKYIQEPAPIKVDWSKWEILGPVDKNKFDFTWRPDPDEPPFIYVWGTKYKHESAEEKPVLKYHTPGATQIKYIQEPVELTTDWDKWEIDSDINVDDFDFEWRPDPRDPPYIYQFGTLADKNDGPRYITPDNDGEIVYRTRTYIKDNITVNRYYIETSLEELIKQHPNEIFWAMRPRINYDHFDFSWRPDLVETEWESDYVHTFGSKDSEITQTYFVNAKKYLEGKTEIKFVENIQLDELSLSKIFEKPSMFFIDKGNEKSKERFNQLKLLFPTIQKTRYLNSWVDTINRCTTKSKTELLWILSSELDYSNFDFDYYPNPWQSEMVHVFGTQWSKWGSTYLVNKETFTKDSKYLKHVEHMKTLNFVDRNAIAENTYDIVMIDHGNEYSFDSDYIVEYNKSYLQTIKDLLEILPEQRDHYIWLCSSICDYSDFDFSYQVNPFSREQLNVFASGTQKFGDTFMMDVNKMRDIIDEIDDLEEARLNFNNDLLVDRYDAPCIIHGSDSHVDIDVEIDVDKSFPYTTFITEDNKDIINNIEPMNLWDSEKKNILIGSTGASIIVVPKEASDIIETEMYDYPHVKRMPKLEQSKPLDIVFLSNGESCAEENWEHLNSLNIPNRIVRVDGVNGRAAAYHAAANASETPWFFTVFAKLKVNEKFDWGWQPDRMQQPKHYIFHAKNPVNGLTYGHQAMIAYNKKLVLANDGTKGLDFTLDDNHEVVPLKSGVATYNSDEFTTWRTAFREVIKLMNDDSNMSKLRLEKWLTVGEGEYGEYSIQGANDAKEYYEEVDGDWHKIRQSYEWEWLREKFSKK